jgi:radical SAM-linked protein
LCIAYAKRGRLRFTSHRDIQRAFERALRRAAVPMAYSAGFSPHPKVSWTGAAPTGVASEAEYVEIAVTERLDPDALRGRLDAALPAGLDVLCVVDGRELSATGTEQAGAVPTTGLVERLTASMWRVELPGVDEDTLARAVAAFVASDEVRVERLTKNGMRSFDARAAVVSLSVCGLDQPRSGDQSDSRPCAILTMVVRHVTPAVRPDDVLTGLGQVADLAADVPPRVTRVKQGTLDVETGAIGDPLLSRPVVADQGAGHAEA